MIPVVDSFALASTSVSYAPGAWGELLLIAASGGILGMGLSDITSGLTDRFSGDGGDEQEPPGADDFLGEGGGFDDGFDDDLSADGFGDEFDDVDGWDDEDGFDDFGGDGGGGSDLDPRIEELENEVASISSTMGTVRSENEAIQESVEDIEDNIRKLLDIYEMVTRGVNPFVDEPQGGAGMGGSFGLFDEAADGDDGYDELDPDVADADPDSFFDDDFDEHALEDEDFQEDDFAADAVEEMPFDDDVLGDEDLLDGAEDRGGDGGEGKTFDELKSEYQAGNGWDDSDESNEPPVGSTTDADAGMASSGGTTASTDGANGDETDGPGGPNDAASEAERSPADGPTAAEPAGDSIDDASHPDETASGGKPYLETLPPGYGAELLVVEWLTYLRGHSSTSEALRAIKYYETIGWVGSAAANSLQRYLSGLSADDVAPSSGGGTQLTIDHHTNSLHYIGKLAGTDVDVERLEWTGPARSAGRVERRGQRGIQR